jgi:two-component system, chemotaxis family, CheB/CheR fusion protein
MVYRHLMRKPSPKPRPRKKRLLAKKGRAVAQRRPVTANRRERKSERRTESNSFFTVAVGASAGGLEALVPLLKNLKFDSMAFVIVQHMAPTHETALPAILGRQTEIEIVLAKDGMKIIPNRIYVAPPNAQLAVMQGVFHQIPFSGDGHHSLPIDFFFRSLAQDQGQKSIGIVLSGTGTDGTFGLKAIKEQGGITFSQDPESAKYDGMPRSALESGWSDFSLPPEAIAKELMRIGRHPYLFSVPTMTPQEQDGIDKLLLMIRMNFGNDLTYYKTRTIERRIERRMALHKIEKLKDYVKFAHGNKAELKALYGDVLISVTSFFRDQEPFDALKESVLPKILEHKKPGSSLRIWVPACATGEEAYSLAILLMELLESRAQDFRIQIFGTDVDEESINHARHGMYPQNIALDVSPSRLQRFFVKSDGNYQIARRIRDLVVFSVQNVTKDPPFSRVDLISCRNLLIYLQPVMQKKVLRILHYALNPRGYLLLGSSETVGNNADLFSLHDRKNKIYTTKHVTTAAALDFGIGLPRHETPPAISPGAQIRPIVNLAALADRQILELYGPAAVVINENLEIIHFRGRTGAYLEPAQGSASLNILRLARPELHIELRRSIQQALSENRKAEAEVRIGGPKGKLVTLEVIPMIEPETKSHCLLVIFNENRKQPPPKPSEKEKAPHSPTEQRLQELEREIMVTKEYLQSTIEELESSNQELKSTNEELQSSNEELQSTNEELETSKEELQSANEELTTVNDELQTRIGEQLQTNEDLQNVLAGVDDAIVIAGMDLRIRRYTTAAERLFNLVPGDLGRSITQLNSFTNSKLEQIAAKVIETLTPYQEEIETNGRRFLLKLLLYRTSEHSIAGVVIIVSEKTTGAR